MNKKGEIITLLTLISLLILAGVTYFVETSKPIGYVVNIQTGDLYNLNSQSPNCDLGTVSIPKGNIKTFRNEKEANNEGFFVTNQSICP